MLPAHDVEVTSSTTAEVVCAQELRVAGDTSRSLVKWAFWHGWKGIINDAKVSAETGRKSAGVGIFVRDHLGLGHPPDGPMRSNDGRAIAGMVELAGLPKMIVVAAYFRVGEGLSEGSLELMREIGEWCGSHGMPFVIGADWNLSPDDVAATSLADSLQGAIVADTDPIGTCTAEGESSHRLFPCERRCGGSCAQCQGRCECSDRHAPPGAVGAPC